MDKNAFIKQKLKNIAIYILLRICKRGVIVHLDDVL